jgi:hypothetical protein
MRMANAMDHLVKNSFHPRNSCKAAGNAYTHTHTRTRDMMLDSPPPRSSGLVTGLGASGGMAGVAGQANGTNAANGSAKVSGTNNKMAPPALDALKLVTHTLEEASRKGA